MATHTIHVSTNLEELRRELLRSLQRTISLVSAGLSVVNKVDADTPGVSGKSISVSYSKSPPWNSEQLQSEFQDWLVTNGFRDSIESVSLFLESAHKIISIWDLVKKQEDGILIKRADWNNIVTKGIEKFHKYGFPDKLDHLKVKHEIALNDELITQVKSINSARNCLVHRNGIVQLNDINTDNSLEVKWSRMAIVIRDKGGEREFIQGEPAQVSEGGLVGVKYKEESKLFVLGEKVQFTTPEFADITWGLFLFGEDVVMKLNKLGFETGRLRKTEESA